MANMKLTKIVLLITIGIAILEATADECQTKNGYGPCRFPFIWNNKEYDACTEDGGYTGTPWCAYEVYNNGEYKNWAYCGEASRCFTKCCGNIRISGISCIAPEYRMGGEMVEGRKWCEAYGGINGNYGWTRQQNSKPKYTKGPYYLSWYEKSKDWRIRSPHGNNCDRRGNCWNVIHRTCGKSCPTECRDGVKWAEYGWAVNPGNGWDYQTVNVTCTG